MNNYDFTIGKINVPVVVLTAIGLFFNRECISALGCPEYVSIGLDRQNLKLAVKASGSTNPFPHYSFVTEEKKKKRVCLTVSKIRAEIIKLTGMKPNRKGIRFFAGYDENAEMLIVDLSKYIEN